MSKLEKDVSKAVRNALDSLQHDGAIHWHERINSLNVKTAYGGYVRGAEAGTPDYIAVLKGGHIYFCECKSDTGKQTYEQIRFEQRCAGWATYEIVRDVKQVYATVERLTQHYKRKLDGINL